MLPLPCILFFRAREASFPFAGPVKAMLHGANFLATCLATMTIEKHCKLQRGCHTFAIFLRNMQRARWKLFTTLSLAASLESPASKRRVLIGSFSQNCVAGCNGYVTRCNSSRNVYFIFLFHHIQEKIQEKKKVKQIQYTSHLCRMKLSDCIKQYIQIY